MEQGYVEKCRELDNTKHSVKELETRLHELLSSKRKELEIIRSLEE